ncbi:MAG: GAF domain-containing protein, partial [Chloroflexota bacterium]
LKRKLRKMNNGFRYKEKYLADAEVRYRTLVEQIPPIVYIAGIGQHIGVSYISPRINSLGFTQEEWVADPELWLRQIHPEDQARVLAEIEKSAESSKPFRLEYRLRTQAGEARWFLDEVMDVLDEKGQILFRQGFMLDITDRKLAEEALSSREKYLQLLNDMTRTVLLSEDINSTMHTLAGDLAKLIDADDCYITRWDTEKQLTIPVVTTANLTSPYAEQETEADEVNMTSSVMKAGRALAADDALNSPYISPNVAKEYPARSILGIPLIAGENKLGAAIIAFNVPHHFTEEEIERAEQAGRQIALALQYFEQGVEVQQRLKESNALALIGRVLSATEHTGTGKILQLIVNSALDLISQAEESVIHLLDPNEQVLFAEAVSGFSDPNPEIPRVQMKLGEGVAGQVINQGVTINIGDVANDPRFIRTSSQPNFQSLLVAPVQSGGQQIGTISVQSDKKFAFSTQDVELLNALGIQAAIAIENTRLFETTQQQLKEVDALYKTSQGLAASLDTDQLIKEVVLLLHQNFGYYYVQIFIVDSVSGDLILKSGSGQVGDQLLAQNFRIARGRGIVGHVTETGESFVTNNVNAVVFFDRNLLLPDTQSELTVPIKVEGEVVGILDIQHTPPNRFTDDELHLMTAVADQLAVALQKANLYKDLQIALHEEQTVRSQLIQNERLALVGRLLASVSHELNNPLQAIQNALFLLKDETKLSDQASQDLNIILSETERMAALIERLRDTYRPMRQQDYQPVELNNLIEDVHALIATHMRHKEINFDFTPDLDLPIIMGLPDQIRQVVLNLFLNAVEVMRAGGRIMVLTHSLPQQNEVLLIVKDTGPGIDPEILPHIFEPFITGKYTGTGLGLTITHDIIQQHHGRIEAENNMSGGAVFKIWLPVDEKGG